MPPSQPEPEPMAASSSSPTSPDTTIINSVTFNQDVTLITAATTTGILSLSTTQTTPHLLNIPFPNGITTAHRLFRSSFIALHGGHFPDNQVMLFDTHTSACVGELRCRSPILSARLRHDRIAVVLSKKILVYSIKSLALLSQIDTVTNPNGLCEVSCMKSSSVLVCPGLQIGQVRVETYFGTCKKTKFIAAHNSELNCLGLTMDGRYVATASTKGTLIRVFNSLDGTFLREVRRGTERADIQSLAFSSDAQWLASSSDKGTIHVFSLKLDSGSPGIIGSQSPEQPASPRSPMLSLSLMKGVLPKYFSSEWSLAQLHLKEGIRYIVAFVHHESTVLIAGMDGSFYRCTFDPESGGEMKQLEHHNILKPEDPSES